MDNLSIQDFFADTDLNAVAYRGVFNDNSTVGFVDMVNELTTTKVKRKISFLIVESYQNIIRHSDTESANKFESIFGYRINKDHFHMYTSNIVSTSEKETLEKGLQEIEGIEGDDLRQVYKRLLDTNQLSDKGGAGLGLVSMMRKSNNPIQYQFEDFGEGQFKFNVQIDYNLSEEAGRPKLQVTENAVYYNKLIKNRVLFAYKGRFGRSLTLPLMEIIDENVQENKEQQNYMFYHLIVELVQNVSKHGIGEKGENHGSLLVTRDKSAFYVYTSNEIKGDGQDILKHIDYINSLSQEEMHSVYVARIRENLKDDNGNAGVGLLNVRKTTGSNIQCDIIDGPNGKVVNFAAKLAFQNK